MSEDPILEYIDGLGEVIENIGDEIIDEKSEKYEEDVILKSILAIREGDRYSIDTIEGSNHLLVSFSYNVKDDFMSMEMNNKGENDVEKIKQTNSHVKLSSEDYQQLSESADETMTEFFASIGDDVAERFHVAVLDKLKNSSVCYNVNQQQGLVSGFEVYTKLFPLEEDISHKEFYDTVTSILSTGRPTRAYIQYSYGLRNFEEGTIYSQEQLNPKF